MHIGIAILLLVQGVQAQLWKQYKDSADAFLKTNDFNNALLYLDLARKNISKDSLPTESYISLLTSTASLLYKTKNQYADAARFYQEAGEIISRIQGTDNDAYAYNTIYLGQVNYFMHQYDKAENLYKESKKIWRKLHSENSKEYTIACNSLGVLYNDWEKYEQALSEHQEARRIREQLFTKENKDYAQSCNNLAAIYWKLGEYDKAEPLAIEAKEIRGRLKNIPRYVYAISCVTLANIYRDMGKYEKAEALYIEAKNEREVYFTKDNNEYAQSCDILADLYYYMKKYTLAEALYIESKNIREKILSKTDAYYGQSCSNLSVLYREMGRYKEAELLARQSDTIWRQIGTSAEADKAINDNNLGAIYFNLNDYDRAEKYFLDARETWTKNLGDEHPFISENSLNLARVYWESNEPLKADQYYRKAFEAQINQTKKIFSFTSEQEKQLYQERINGAADEYQSFYFKKMNQSNSGLPYTIALLKRNQILSSSNQMRNFVFSSGDSSVIKKYDEWISLRKQLANLYSRGDASLKSQITSISDRSVIVEKELVKSSTKIDNAIHATINWPEIQSHLDPTEAAIEFVEFNYFNGKKSTDSVFYAALVLTKKMVEPEIVFLFEEKQLDSLFHKAWTGDRGINTFYSRGLRTRKNSSISQKAYSLIWDPIASKLKGIKKIFFAPAGLLYRVAFAALPIDSVSVLSDKYNLVQVSTTASIIAKNEVRIDANEKISLFGGILYSKDPTKRRPQKKVVMPLTARSGFEYLPGTAKEVEEIAESGVSQKIYPVLLKGFQAKEDSLKALDGIRSPAVIHIATHGFFFDDPDKKDLGNDTINSGGDVFRLSTDPLFRSGLLFAGANDSWKRKPVLEPGDDGILTAYEVSNLFLPNTKLVVLSACETALGDIKGSEGVYGLQRSFKMAGVKNLIMSLWKVPDIETVEFMQLFYSNLFEGKTVLKSFHIAQSKMKDKFREDPYKWAAWVLVQ